MCDYSLQGLPNRLAQEGEVLTTYRFRTGSMGLASPVDMAARACPQRKAAEQRGWWQALLHWLNGGADTDELPAVCIPPGARLMMTRVPDRLRREFALSATEEVTFIQLSAEAFQFRDAIRFADGRQLLLQSFPSSVLFQVLKLAEVPAEEQVSESPVREEVTSH